MAHSSSRTRPPPGKEMFFITPLLLGGSATDSANVTFLTREQHIQAVRYWNRIIAHLREESSREDPSREDPSDSP